MAQALPQSIIIEPAVPADAEAIMHIKRDAWFETYVNEAMGVTLEDIKRKFTDADLAEGVKNWQRGIADESPNGDRQTFVARLDGRVVGFTSPFIKNDQRRVGAMYVTADVKGSGIGGRLLQQALVWHGLDKDVYLRVVSYNDHAIGFYRHYGFVPTGKSWPLEFDPNKRIKLLPEIEMVHKGKAATAAS
jgi:GNAT superfamily N-acetyltransferase